MIILIITLTLIYFLLNTLRCEHVFVFCKIVVFVFWSILFLRDFLFYLLLFL